MSDGAAILMLSAMYENGGNTTHRFLDGHPQMFVYPFESQLGTQLVSDRLASLYPVKYRWPVFALDATPADDYKAIIDEEVKIRARTPDRSKFKIVPFDFSDDERLRCYERHVAANGRSTGGNVVAFMKATSDAWRDRKRTGRETVYVGYSPILVVDADKILGDLPGAHILHVVRNPWSAYADTKKRPVPLRLRDYMVGWTVAQQHALVFQARFPGHVHVIRFEDLIADPVHVLGAVCSALGLEVSPSLAVPSWNGAQMTEIYPWGTIRTPTRAQNLETAAELGDAEYREIEAWAGPLLDGFDYRGLCGR